MDSFSAERYKSQRSPRERVFGILKDILYIALDFSQVYLIVKDSTSILGVYKYTQIVPHPFAIAILERQV